MKDVRFRPIADWPGERRSTHRYAPFRAKWSVTLRELDRELRALDARNVVIQIDLREDQIRRDGWPKAGHAQPPFPGVIIDFDSKHGHLRYATDEFTRYEDNLRGITLALEALRKVDRYGVSRRGEQYAGWKALPETAGDVDLVARGKALIAEYGTVREALRNTHPDHGGDPEDFRAVMAARDA